MRLFAATGILLAPLLLACEAGMPVEPAMEPAFSRADDVRVVASATGTYRIQPGIAPIDASISAVLKGDGRVMGGAEFTLLSGTIISDVVCLSVVGNAAWIGLRHVGGTHPAVVGGVSYGWIRVVDNGQGSHADADGASGIAAFQTETAALNYCANRPAAPPLNTVLSGNIQVRER